ncbi:hypothetical protein AMJ86_01080 [bacterium SM23_57]|nr:MAG: hypothetical protein AMJ86_01080 [bacterium SM23_57]
MMDIRIGLIVIIISFFIFGCICGVLINTEFKADEIAAYELSFAAMEQHIYIRDARAEEQRMLIDLLIKEHNNTIKELNGRNEQS